MSWIVTLKIVDCSASSTLLVGARIGSPLIDNLAHAVFTDANGQAQIFDAYDQWEWVNLTISKASYIDKNFVITMAMDGTIQTVCLNAMPPPDPNAPEPQPVSCFIVSATTGSPDSAELVRLRALRDRIAGSSRIAAHLIEAIYDEYAEFSPAIAAELTTDAAARRLVLDSVVRPLLAWYTLAGALGLRDDPDTVAAATIDFHASFPPSGLVHEPGAEIARLSQEVLARTDLPLATWAILDSLTAAWRCRTEHLDPAAEIAHWLVDAPLESLGSGWGGASSGETGVPDIDRELETLTGFLDFAPQHRQELVQKIARATSAASHNEEC